MPNGALAISLRDGDETPSQLPFAAVLQQPLCFPSIFLVIGSLSPFYLVLVCIAVAVLDVLSLRRMPWFPYRRYAGNPTFDQPNKVSPPSGHWNPSRSTGTLEPLDIGTPGKCTGRGKDTDPRTGKGHRPKERFSFFQVPPWQSPAVSPLRVSLPSCSWRLRRPG